ncbi:hypothetical protein NPIL_123281 [Nephila pilipes]|uniref:Uncharacterized protein n=1 Tax=Nephila pilipes TaxID=299642 RepID=A0A8X6K7F5_NEPPI|nr:hypothetical protein NPIL_123281 [Nephila pilipes]
MDRYTPVLMIPLVTHLYRGFFPIDCILITILLQEQLSDPAGKQRAQRRNAMHVQRTFQKRRVSPGFETKPSSLEIALNEAIHAQTTRLGKFHWVVAKPYFGFFKHGIVKPDIFIGPCCESNF